MQGALLPHLLLRGRYDEVWKLIGVKLPLVIMIDPGQNEGVLRVIK